jgi:hypothetical protein
MGLEIGTYISDLNPNNPVHATDQVGEGDDHLRLIKSTILNTFPNITGAVPWSQATFDDAALKSAANVFTAANTFNLGVTFDGSNIFNGENVFNDKCTVAGAANTLWTESGLLYASAQLTDFDLPEQALGVTKIFNSGFGPANNPGGANYYSGIHFRHRVANDYSTHLAFGAVVNNTIPDVSVRHNNSGGYGPWYRFALIEKEQVWQARQTMANAQFWSSNNSTGTARGVLGITAGNVCQMGNDAHDMQQRADTKIGYYVGGAEEAQLVPRASGSFLVKDSGGFLKKAGFRNPTITNVTGTRAFTQGDEGQILNISVGGVTLSANTLEQYTVLRIRTGANGCNLNSGTATIRWLAGDGSSITGNFTIAAYSIVELSYGGASNVDLFGNGISTAP